MLFSEGLFFFYETHPLICIFLSKKYLGCNKYLEYEVIG